MRKRSQVFMFDLIFAFIIIVVSIGMVVSYYGETTTNLNLYETNYEILDGITKTNINALNDEEIRNLFRQSLIRNVGNSIAQQISEFHYLGEDDLAINLTGIFVEDYITRQTNANITLNDPLLSNTLVLFERTPKSLSKKDATIVTSINRTVIGFVDETHAYGPYILTITLWI